MPEHKPLEMEEEGQIVAERKLAPPDHYKVFLHNDDYTTMDFVVNVLRRVFNKSHEDATAIMLAVHHGGVGECGVYTFEIAETKVARVQSMAREAGFPLKCTMEKV